MQMIQTTCAPARRYDIGIGNCLWQLCNDRIHACTSASLIGIHEFTYQQRYFFGLEIQVFDQIVVNAFNFRRPLLVVRVGLPLMQQYPLDNAIFLSQFCHVDKILIGISVVCLDYINHPRWSCCSICLVVILVEQFDFAAGNRDINNTDFDIFRQVGNHCSAKIISGAKTARWST